MFREHWISPFSQPLTCHVAQIKSLFFILFLYLPFLIPPRSSRFCRLCPEPGPFLHLHSRSCPLGRDHGPCPLTSPSLLSSQKALQSVTVGPVSFFTCVRSSFPSRNQASREQALSVLSSLVIPHGAWLVVGTTRMRGGTGVVGVGNTLRNGVSETSKGIISNSPRICTQLPAPCGVLPVMPRPKHSPPCGRRPVGYAEGSSISAKRGPRRPPGTRRGRKWKPLSWISVDHTLGTPVSSKKWMLPCDPVCTCIRVYTHFTKYHLLQIFCILVHSVGVCSVPLKRGRLVTLPRISWPIRVS